MAMDDLLLRGLKDIYYAENEIVRIVQNVWQSDKPRSQESFKGPSRRNHETSQSARPGLQDAGPEPQGVRCSAVDDLVDQADEVVREVEDKIVLDSGVISSAQALEHYEMAHGTLSHSSRNLAGTMSCGFSRAISTKKGRQTKAFDGSAGQSRQAQSSELTSAKRETTMVEKNLQKLLYETLKDSRQSIGILSPGNTRCVASRR